MQNQAIAELLSTLNWKALYVSIIYSGSKRATEELQVAQFSDGLRLLLIPSGRTLFEGLS